MIWSNFLGDVLADEEIEESKREFREKCESKRWYRQGLCFSPGGSLQMPSSDTVAGQHAEMIYMAAFAKSCATVGEPNPLEIE